MIWVKMFLVPMSPRTCSSEQGFWGQGMVKDLEFLISVSMCLSVIHQHLLTVLCVSQHQGSRDIAKRRVGTPAFCSFPWMYQKSPPCTGVVGLGGHHPPGLLPDQGPPIGFCTQGLLSMGVILGRAPGGCSFPPGRLTRHRENPASSRAKVCSAWVWVTGKVLRQGPLYGSQSLSIDHLSYYLRATKRGLTHVPRNTCKHCLGSTWAYMLALPMCYPHSATGKDWVQIW